MMLRNSCVALSKQISKHTSALVPGIGHQTLSVPLSATSHALVSRTLSVSVARYQQFTSPQSTNIENDETQWKHSGATSQPIILSSDIQFPPPNTPLIEAWVESLNTVEDNKVGLIDLHPDIFGAFPRIDLIQQNITWQVKYRKIDYRCFKTRAEARGGGRKPKPQKKAGVRLGSRRSPMFPKGGTAFGPRGPKSYFYMLHDLTRTHGLCSTLSIKLAQNDLFIVDSLDIPSDELEYLEDLVDARFWGFSVLFVDDTDIMPKNITLAVEEKPSFNLMPLYGLNVYSMLKHEKLVLTLAAVKKLQEKLLYQFHKTDRQKPYVLHGR